MNPYPVHDPRHNLRELIKECILLELHLFDPSKYCKDCIRKHFLTIEAFAGPELVSLDLDQKYTDVIARLAMGIPNWQRAWVAGADPREIAQEIRSLRKQLTPTCFADEESTGIISVDSHIYGEDNTQPAPQLYAEDEVQSFEITCPHCLHPFPLGV